MLATGTPRDSLRRPVGRPALLLLGTGLILVAGVFAATAVAYAWPTEPWPPTDRTFVGSTGDFEAGSVTPLFDRGIAGYLVRLEDGEFLAFDRAEPVNGCTLVWGQPRSLGFKDPCHGYEYDVAGNPSQDNFVRLPLTQFEVRVDRDGDVHVVVPAERE